jgi:hypothetical protein
MKDASGVWPKLGLINGDQDVFKLKRLQLEPWIVMAERGEVYLRVTGDGDEPSI